MIRMYNVLKINKIAAIGTDRLGSNYNCADSVENPDAVLVRSAAMHDMEFGDNLLAIARAGAGTNNIPKDKCTEQGIVVFNTPGTNANAVKELVLAGLLLSSRKIVEGIEWAKTLKGNGDAVAKMVEKGKSQFVGPEITGKTLGVIGLGAIGGMVANAAGRLGMDVYGVDPYLSVHNALVLSHNVKVLKTYDELFKKCDYITMHLHLTDKTRGSIGKEAFDAMKKGVIVLNFSRGEIVDNAALKEALDSGKVAKYVTDFPDPEVVKMKNVIATPHLGASTGEAEENCAEMAAAEIRDYLENGDIRNSVNLPDCDAGYMSSTARITIIHRNKPNMLSKFTQVIADEDINIAHLNNTSRGEYAYCVLDIDSVIPDGVVDKMNAIEDVIRVRVIR